MNSVDSTTTNEKLLALPEMKVEDCDDYSEHSGNFVKIKLR